ncbi:hypothetical protein A176_001769 [Myxococcus hansupus]|uniref:Uncharacterized protein n=1 Tax=Pseudomyxococcus hansupus TaxID=1297742 RepID=A0A0H4XAC3_9BACT|nr:hypothetical protein A176_001769 [Myxococcus hansupus]
MPRKCPGCPWVTGFSSGPSDPLPPQVNGLGRSSPSPLPDNAALCSRSGERNERHPLKSPQD